MSCAYHLLRCMLSGVSFVCTLLLTAPCQMDYVVSVVRTRHVCVFVAFFWPHLVDGLCFIWNQDWVYLFNSVSLFTVIVSCLAVLWLLLYTIVLILISSILVFLTCITGYIKMIRHTHNLSTSLYMLQSSSAVLPRLKSRGSMSMTVTC